VRRVLEGRRPRPDGREDELGGWAGAQRFRAGREAAEDRNVPYMSTELTAMRGTPI
jgi:hypothetical protein